MEKAEDSWDLILKPTSKWYDLRIGEIIRYKDLLLLFVRRDFVSLYKQTILGPLWFFIQPLIMSLTFTLIFGNVANISTDGVPQILFYMCGITLWTYFADTLTKTSETFTANANMFGKVYFPRIIVPLSIVVSNLIKLGMQFALFLLFMLYFLFIKKDVTLHPNSTMLLVPVLILMMGFLGLGLGIIITSLTTKYRDLKFLIVFGVQLLMYASGVVIPLSAASSRYRWLMIANPVTSIIEAFKYAFLGVGEFSWVYLGYSALFTVIVFVLGLIIFQRVEKSFLDTV